MSDSNKEKLSRRDFLIRTAVTGGAIALGGFGILENSPSSGEKKLGITSYTFFHPDRLDLGFHIDPLARDSVTGSLKVPFDAAVTDFYASETCMDSSGNLSQGWGLSFRLGPEDSPSELEPIVNQYNFGSKPEKVVVSWSEDSRAQPPRLLAIIADRNLLWRSNSVRDIAVNKFLNAPMAAPDKVFSCQANGLQ